ncbi:MAG: hypothetical protein AAF705_03750, partial [Bacteroidota bacterium]
MYLKIISTGFLLLLSSLQVLLAQNCSYASVVLTNQTAVDNFVANSEGCETITINGTLNILGGSITDISGLRNITSIRGSLFIRFTNTLSDLDDLQNLTSIGSNLVISENDALDNLDGLQNITSIGGLATVGRNNVLKNLDGLQSLRYIGGNLDVLINPMLSNIDGLQNVRFVDGTLSIRQNLVLNEFCGLHGLLNADNNGITSINISGNPANNLTAEAIRDGEACARILPTPAEDLPLMPKSYLLLLVLGISGALYLGARRLH